MKTTQKSKAAEKRKKSIADSGNITIYLKELECLRKGVLEKYNNIGDGAEKVNLELNSNLKNYQKLYDSINSNGSLQAVDINSAKPLSGIFYYSSKHPNGQGSFRKKFINALYQYAFEMSREKYLLENNIEKTATHFSEVDTVIGYWELYYDRKNEFNALFREKQNAYLNKICMVVTKESNTVNQVKVKFFHFKGLGVGTIEVHGNKIAFQLRGENDHLHWLLQQSVIKSIQTIEREYLPDDNVLLLNVIGGMANQYIIDLRRNCRRGMEGKAERGWSPTTAPLGYINDLSDRTIKPDPERYEAVRKMWDMLLSGKYRPMEILDIANNEWGFRTPKHKRMGGKEISSSLIYKVFSNIFYTGMFEWAGKLYEGKHKPMVTFAEFDQVQLMLGRKGKPRPQHHNFAYTGFISCATCGAMVTATEKKKLIKSTGQYGTYTYYHCTRKKKGVVCHNQPVTLPHLESQFEEILEMYHIAPEFLAFGLDMLHEEKGRAVTDMAAVNAMQEKSLSETQKELDNLTRMRYRELIDDASFIKERDILRDKITRLTAELHHSKDNADKWIELTEHALNFAAHAQDHFQDGTVNAKKEICSSLGSNYSLKDKNLLFEASVWLIPIAKAYPELIVEYRRLELQKYLDTEVWNTGLASIIQRWSAR